MSASEKHHFQAETQQLLDIVIHSLYTDKEIFIRELISNSADASEKLRFLQTAGRAVHQPELPLKVSVATDDKENTLTVADAGIGMTHGELVENLGTIAHSGSKAFLAQFTGDQKPETTLIGQFGVGFYSAFMVAKHVTVYSRSYLPEETGWCWSSDGSGVYEMTPASDLPRGTKVLVQLRDDDQGFAQAFKVEQIIKRYSNFVPFTIELNGKEINTVRAIWTRNKSEIKDEEYDEFYHYLGHDPDSPLYRLHFTADAPLAIQSVLFVPARNFEVLGMGRSESEVNLYCRRILIQAKAKGLFPDWLRFLKGVVDSEDLPLNISRETMQDSTLMQKLNKVLTGRFLKFLEEQAEADAAAYDKFFEQYGRFLKEGVVIDFTHKDTLGKLLRYESSALEASKRTALADYIKRMPAEQKEIYYLVAPNREAAEASPYFEVFQAKKFEVLFSYEPWDEFVMEHLYQFDGKTVRPAEKADLKIDDTTPPADALSNDQAQALAKWLKETLGERVKEVNVSQRLVGSPAVVVESDQHLTASMRRVFKSMGKDGTAAARLKQNLEVNPRHPVIVRLEKMRATDADLARKVAEQVLDNALVGAGLLEDPRTMLKRLNELLEKVLAAN
jgi:TNF receptor-associated protein 1